MFLERRTLQALQQQKSPRLLNPHQTNEERAGQNPTVMRTTGTEQSAITDKNLFQTVRMSKRGRERRPKNKATKKEKRIKIERG